MNKVGSYEINTLYNGPGSEFWFFDYILKTVDLIGKK